MTGNLQGSQTPRVEWLPPGGTPHPDGVAALELVTAAGVNLDPWQSRIFEKSLLQRDGRWAAFEVALVCPRQNGKNELLLARELAGLFILGERLIIHTAHLADTAKEAFRRLEEVIASSDWLAREVKHVWRTNGHEAIELKNGQRVRFRTRTKGGGRGFSADALLNDEAMDYPEASHAATLPVLSAMPNPQAWYAASAVDEEIHDDGLVLTRVRNRGLARNDPSLAYFEFSHPAEHPANVTPEEAGDIAAWAQANPALGIRIMPEHVGNEHRSMDHRRFVVERLGVGVWPSPESNGAVINLEQWRKLADAKSYISGAVVLAYDVSPDRRQASICAAGTRPDGLLHVETIDRRQGTGWLVDRLAELTDKHRADSVLCDSIGPGASLVDDLDAKGVRVTTVNGREHANACGVIYDLVDQERLRHLGTTELDAAIRGAEKRPLGDAWLWSRKNSGVDITALVAVTLAVWKASQTNESVYERRGLLVLG